MGLTLVHENEAAGEQRHAVGGLVIVQVLEPPAAAVGLLVHVAGGIADHLQEALLLGLAQVLVQEVVGRGEAHEGVGQGNLVPWSVFHQPETQEQEGIQEEGTRRIADYRRPQRLLERYT